MNAKSIILPAVITLALCAPLSAQHQHEMKSAAKPAPQDMSARMGEPTFRRSIDGLEVKVWLIPQEEHRKMMAGHMQGKGHGQMAGGMMHEGMGMHHGTSSGTDEDMMKEMMAGTHHIAVGLSGKKAVDSAAVDLQVVSPTGEAFPVKLRSMRGHFGGGITLDKEGEYMIALHVKSGESTWHLEFPYTVGHKHN
ncbi:MAG: hypothetical protein AB1428_02570 [Bacteroidota bacterium]